MGVLASGLCAGCRSGAASPASIGLAPSILPNLGLAATASLAVREESPWHLEARFTDQFADDKTIADNGFPEAGDWTQLDLGLLHLPPLDAGRAWGWRFGVSGFEARGEPNLVDESGDYLGAYLGLGRFTVLAPGLLLGPELTVVAATGPDDFVLFPQLTWGVRWSPGSR